MLEKVELLDEYASVRFFQYLELDHAKWGNTPPEPSDGDASHTHPLSRPSDTGTNLTSAPVGLPNLKTILFGTYNPIDLADQSTRADHYIRLTIYRTKLVDILLDRHMRGYGLDRLDINTSFDQQEYDRLWEVMRDRVTWRYRDIGVDFKAEWVTAIHGSEIDIQRVLLAPFTNL